MTSQWNWNLSGLGADTFAIAFEASDINLSLDSATLDVRAVPEPGPVALALVGAAVIGWARRGARRSC